MPILKYYGPPYWMKKATIFYFEKFQAPGASAEGGFLRISSRYDGVNIVWLGSSRIPLSSSGVISTIDWSELFASLVSILPNLIFNC